MEIIINFFHPFGAKFLSSCKWGCVVLLLRGFTPCSMLTALRALNLSSTQIGERYNLNLQDSVRPKGVKFNPTVYIVDFAITCIQRYYPNKLMGSGCKPEPTGGKQVEVYAVREGNDWIVITIITRYF